MVDPDQWGAYARLQTVLADKPVVDGHSWGLEAGLDRHLAALGEPRDDDDADRAVRSESRRERHRARLRRVYLINLDGAPELDAQLDARRTLYGMRDVLSDADWRLLVAVAEGRAYGELAAVFGASACCLRVRVLRLRREMHAAPPASQPARRAA
jgi:hypothetical protein